MAPSGYNRINRIFFNLELINPICDFVGGDEVHAFKMAVRAFVEAKFGAGTAF